MTWLALEERPQNWAATDKDQPEAAACSELLGQGAIVVDMDFSVSNIAPCKLISHVANLDWVREFTVYLNADYSISVEAIQGPGRCYARLADVNLRDAGIVRLTYSWNAPEKLGLLSLESAEDGFIHQIEIQQPIPLPLDDAISLVKGSPDIKYDERVTGIALCDQPTTIGPAATIAKGAMVETTQGPRAIERLQRGDMIRTRDGGEMPVRWIVEQRLPAMGRSAPIILRAPYFGLVRDIIVASDQRVLITGSETEYNFGQETVLIEASNLIGHAAATPLLERGSMNLYQVLLDEHQCINISGAWVDSIYIGRLAKIPQVLATTVLSDIPRAVLPIHRQQTRPVLRNYERQAVLDALTA